MNSVLLVDDDYLVRMYLRQLIDWEKEGFWLVGDACNGEEALRLMEASPVQLLITDLGMPVVDGISLIRTVRRQYPDTRIAVLSCHDEFEYVKDAMQLGADEYVLKNELDAASLRALLAGLSDKLAESRARQSERQELWELAQKGSRQLKRETLEALLAQEYPYDTQREMTGAGKWNGSYHAVGVIAIDLRRQANTDALEQVCLQLLRDETQEFFICATEALVVVDLSRQLRRSEQDAHMRQLAQRIAAAIEQYAAQTPALAVSAVHTADGGITRALQQAVSLLAGGFYGQAISYAGSLPPLAGSLPAGAAALLEQLRQTPLDTEAAMAAYAGLMKHIEKHPVQPQELLAWLAEMDAATGLAGQQPPADFAACRQREALYREALARREAGLELKTDKPAIRRVVRHIREHFQEPLSLQSVAELVQLNPAYLSHLFKKETGMGFSEYLQQQRLEYVLHELAHSGRPAKEIAAAAGFFDYRHFSKLFKKQTGLSPAEWKRRGPATAD